MTKIHMTQKVLSLLGFLIVCVTASSAWAGGPYLVNESGVAAAWDNSSAIVLSPEAGDCATFSNADMVTKLTTNISHWSDISDVSLTFDVQTGDITDDIDSSNYNDYYVDSSDDPGLNDGINPIIFDDDGSIVVDLFGSGNEFSVLGFSGPDGLNADQDTILDAQAVYNCRCLSGNAAGACSGSSGTIVFTEDDLDFTMTHETGHLIGLDHTQVNQTIAESGGCDTSVTDECDDIPTMYPQSVDAADQQTPTREDEVIVLTLYGNSTWEDDKVTVTGTLTDRNGDALRCADIQAHTSDPADTVAVVSGAFAPAVDDNGDGYSNDDDECLSDCGDFVLRGLDAGKNYTITVKPIDELWVGGSSISPCGVEQKSGIVEEDLVTITGTSGEAIALTASQTQTSSTGGARTTSSGASESTGCSLNTAQGFNYSGGLLLLLPFFSFLFRRKEV